MASKGHRPASCAPPSGPGKIQRGSKDEAHAKNDRRVLRLFGEDDELEKRERTAWTKMMAEDRAALKEE